MAFLDTPRLINQVIDWVLETIEAEMPLLADIPKVDVFRRKLRGTDPRRSVSCFLTFWTPLQNERVMGQPQPILNNYTLRVQNLVKGLEEVQGREVYVADAALVQAILYRAPASGVAFPAFEEELLGLVERVTRIDVMQQEFMNDYIEGQFMYLCGTEVRVQTETTKQ